MSDRTIAIPFHRALRVTLGVGAVLVLWGCGSAPVPGADAGQTDSGTGVGGDGGSLDAGRVDAGQADGGSAVQDSGTPDAGAPDAGGLGSDAGVDAGDSDAGAPDGGAPDAGAPDAGAPDAGAPDAGAPDAGPGGPPACGAVANGCTVFTNLTASATPTVAFGGALGLAYSPSCATVSVGQTVTFQGSFNVHPLAETCGPDATIVATSSGTTTTFTFTTAGLYGYECVRHSTLGMTGAINVIP